LAAKNKNEMMSIKLTGLLDVRVLKKMNDVVEFRDAFWKKNSTNGEMKYVGLKKGLVELISDVTDEDIQVYLEKVHGFKGELSTFTTHELGFKANHHPYYITSEEKNKIKVI
jgi:hypothetical protein